MLEKGTAVCDKVDSSVSDPNSKRIQDTSSSESLQFALVIAGVFFVAAYIGITKHEMWRDEYRSFVLGQSCNSIFDVFGAFRTEGLPSVWNYLVFAVTSLTSDIFYMQVLHIAIATGAVFLLARYSPFKLWQKVMLAFGYFPFFEYNLVSRCYGLGELFLFAFCALHSIATRATHSSRLNFILRIVSLALLANTSLYGAILAFAIVSGVLAEAFFNSQRTLTPAQKRGIALGAGALIAAASVASVMVLTSHGTFKGDWTADRTNAIWRYCRAGVVILTGYIPIPTPETGQFWSNSVWKISTPHHDCWFTSIALFGVFLLSFADKRLAFVSYLVGTLSMVALTLFFLLAT
jgi:hypothetical protein